MSNATRNAQIKKLMVAAFKGSKISVTGGRGTASGWVDLRVGYSPRNQRECQELRALIMQLLSKANVYIGTYGCEDGDYGHGKEISISFSACREKADGYGDEAYKQHLSAADWDAMQVSV